MNYESEALIFYHDKPEENIFNLSCFLQKRKNDYIIITLEQKVIFIF